MRLGEAKISWIRQGEFRGGSARLCEAVAAFRGWIWMRFGEAEKGLLITGEFGYVVMMGLC